MGLDTTVHICNAYCPHYSMFLHETWKCPSLELVVNLELDQKVARGCFKHFEPILIPLVALGLSCYTIAGHEDVFASAFCYFGTKIEVKMKIYKLGINKQLFLLSTYSS